MALMNEYSEGDVGSSSNQEEGERLGTPSIVSMAVSAKKGRVSVSNAGSVMGHQQTQISDFGGRSTGFYNQETQDHGVIDEYQQYKQ